MVSILLLDDCADFRQISCILLRQAGYHTLPAATIHDCMLLLEQHKPSLIIIDVNLKEGDGRKICKDLKEKPATRDIPVILISADPDKLLAAHDWLADEVMEKPFDMPALIKKIEVLMMG